MCAHLVIYPVETEVNCHGGQRESDGLITRWKMMKCSILRKTYQQFIYKVSHLFKANYAEHIVAPFTTDLPKVATIVPVKNTLGFSKLFSLRHFEYSSMT